MVALVGQSTSDPLDELTKMLGLFGDLSFMWHDFAGTSASTPVLTQHHEAVAERAHDALVDAVPCRTRSSATSSPTTVASPESESLNDATPSPRCDSADSTETFCGSEPFAAACLAVPPTSAANPDVSRESEVARMNLGSTAAPRPHKSSDANTHGGRAASAARAALTPAAAELPSGALPDGHIFLSPTHSSLAQFA